MKDMGKRICELRKANHLTQSQLGKIAGLHGSNISRIEQNAVLPNAQVIRNIADYFHVTCDYLVGRTLSETKASLDFVLDSSLDEEAAVEDQSVEESNRTTLPERHRLIQMFEQLNESNREEFVEILKLKLHMQELNRNDETAKSSLETDMTV